MLNLDKGALEAITIGIHLYPGLIWEMRSESSVGLHGVHARVVSHAISVAAPLSGRPSATTMIKRVDAHARVAAIQLPEHGNATKTCCATQFGRLSHGSAIL